MRKSKRLSRSLGFRLSDFAMALWIAAGGGLAVTPAQQLPVAPQLNVPLQRNTAYTAGRIGNAACLPCHQQYNTSYLGTAHHLTSQLAGKDTILGPFSGRGSTLRILDPIVGGSAGSSNPGLYFQMEARDGGYYQTAVAGVPGDEQSHSARIDVVTGSGTRGQSYLNWQGDQLFELPLSYWSDGRQWINSPGYKDQTANFSRPIYPRCLECHASSIVARSPDPLSNHYDPESLVKGISCESCHGPGAEHVSSHEARRERPSSGDASADTTILNPARFSRDRQVDLCALCHSGAQREELQPAFSYIPGQPLDSYLKPGPAESTAQPEVHGNQVGLLKKSRCYLSSPTMSCSTCHDVHAAERPAASYSNKCLNCHRVESCNLSKTLGPKIADNCIDCHMPKQPTQAIVAKTAGKVVRATMRTHWIKIYPPVTAP